MLAKDTFETSYTPLSMRRESGFGGQRGAIEAESFSVEKANQQVRNERHKTPDHSHGPSSQG